MLSVSIKPGDKLIKGYYDVLGGLGQLHFDHEGAVRSAFHDVLAGYGRKLHWTLVGEYPMKGAKGRIAIDGALLDEWKQRHGFWEAKDMRDQLDREIRRKIEQGYPTTNTIFQMPARAVLFQRGVRQGLNEDITSPKNLVDLLTNFFAYREPEHEEWDAAVAEFGKRIPELATRAKEIIDGERKDNRDFREAFESFYSVCRKAINPNLSDAAVEEMLIQHLLTERIFRRVFHAEEFRSRNVIAAEIEKVITSMTSRHFSRDQFLSDLDRFYKAIERAADDKDDYSEKQAFLNTVYERFFQGYSPKEADTHGIVYTPQPIVDFMVRSVEDILKKEFGRSLADHNVHILDPFVGTGNFITRVMRQIAETDKGALPYKYENELHCNEVMLLPYYIASMNIEHEYLAQTGEYRPFNGICLVDTFELAEPEQGGLEFMTEENTERVKRQKQAPIFVVIGNPPYNVGQQNENDQNKNRFYPALDKRIRDTYIKSSGATLLTKLSDPYVKAFRWATDRLGSTGVVAFVTNNGFIDQAAFDGMRRELRADFSRIIHLNLKGNARTAGERRRAEGGNVFDDQIRVSVGITFLIKSTAKCEAQTIEYYEVDDFLSSQAKRNALTNTAVISGIEFRRLTPDARGTWLTAGQRNEFEDFLPLGTKDKRTEAIFHVCTNGVLTARDALVYNFSDETLRATVEQLIREYNRTLAVLSAEREITLAALIKEAPQLKWTRRLGRLAAKRVRLSIGDGDYRLSQYRPFASKHLFFSKALNEEIYSLKHIYPLPTSENIAIAVTDRASRSSFACLASRRTPNYCVIAATDSYQNFAFYTYSEDGSNRRENITDWALEQFRSHYHDRSISKWDIFHYVYAVLHHPEYRSRYAANLKRELPRIPFLGAGTSKQADVSGHDFSRADERASHDAALAAAVEAPGFSPAKPDAKQNRALAPVEISPSGAKAPLDSPAQSAGLKPGASTQPCATPVSDREVFRRFVEAGKRLAELHVHYEQQPEYKLEKIWKEGSKLDYRVTKMRLSKDKSILTYNDALTLKGIPKETYDYRLGNRSALEWVIDQYQVSTDKRSGITNDPNRPDDPQYILRLIGQVITVSLATVKIVQSLPEFVIDEKAQAADPRG